MVKDNEESSTSTSIESPPPPEYIHERADHQQDKYRESLPKIHEPKEVVGNETAKTCKIGHCYFDGCLNSRVYKGFCATHAQRGNGKRCSQEGCTKYALKEGVYTRHGSMAFIYFYSFDGCTKQVNRVGACWRHGA